MFFQDLVKSYVDGKIAYVDGKIAAILEVFIIEILRVDGELNECAKWHTSRTII